MCFIPGRDSSPAVRGAWFLCLYGAFVLGIGNCIFEVVRLSCEDLNRLFFMGVLCLPVAMLGIALQYRRWLDKVVVGALAVPGLLVSMLLGFIMMLDLGSFERVGTIKLPYGRIAVFRTDMGAIGSPAIIVRHERALVPGVLLVRRILAPWPDGRIKVTAVGKTKARIRLVGYDGRLEKDLKVNVLRWVYF